jgi:Tfp pilus assembly major pilin PilA
MRSRQTGITLIETMIVAAIGAVLVGITVPHLVAATARLRVREAAEEIRGTFRLAQSMALRYDANVGVKFRTRPDGSVTFALYRDGDGDGVLTTDIDRGVDPEIQAPRVLQHVGRGVGFGFPPGIVPRDPSDPRHNLTKLDDPIRFNASDIASFSALSTSTPGSVYLTDHKTVLAAVRVLGTTGRTAVVFYDAKAKVWR